MANLSEAIGTFYLIGDWSDDDKRGLINVLMSLDYCEYSTSISSGPESVLNSLLDGENDIPFYGTGRWAYKCNLVYFDNWTTTPVPMSLSLMYLKENTIEEYLKERSTLLQSMYDKKLSIRVEYVDYECGCGVLYEAEGVIEVTLNESGYHFVYNTTQQTTYEPNLKNFNELFEDNMNMFESSIKAFMDYYNIPEELFDFICNKIEEHPTWYDMEPYQDYFDEYTDYRWSESILKLLKEKPII
jgi:hypothetical protein